MLTERGVEAEVVIPLAPAVQALQPAWIEEALPGTEAPYRYRARLSNGGASGTPVELACRAAGIPRGYTVLADAAAGAIPTLEELELAPVRYPLVVPAGKTLPQLAADCVLDFATVSNRGDLLSHLGIGREAALATGGELRMPPLAELDPAAAGEDRPAIELPAPELCPRYVGCYFEAVRIAPSPDWMAYRLSLCGATPISNIVDLSNYLLLELGQPMHTFDRDLLRGTISARRARPGERFTAINHVEYQLTDKHLVIADEKHAVALAGVMGGLDSEIRDSTQRVLLESAFFTPRNIRMTSKRLGLQSESSLRFGRGIDPMLPPVAARRFIRLAEDLGAARYVPGSFVDANLYEPAEHPIAFDCAHINALLGTDFSDSGIVHSLQRLGLQVERTNSGFTAHSPSWRHDLAIWEDLAEEVLRLNLFDSLAARPLLVPLKSGRHEAELAFARQVEDLLTRLGAQQVMCQPFLPPRRAELFYGSAHDLVALQNPDTADQAFLQASLLPGMLAVVEHNLRHGERSPLLFELARVYSRREFASGVSYLLQTPDGDYFEQQALGLAFGDGFIPPALLPPDFSAESPVFMLKGVVSELLRVLGIGEAEFTAGGHSGGLLPGRCFSLALTGRPLGFLGEVDPAAMEAGETRLAFAQVSLAVLEAQATKRFQMAGFSVYPRIERDLALLVPLALPVSAVLDTVRAAAGPLLADLHPFDLYRGKQVPAGHKSVALRLTFQSAERTLTGAEVDELMLAVLKALYERNRIMVRDFSRLREARLFSDERCGDALRQLYGA